MGKAVIDMEAPMNNTALKREASAKQTAAGEQVHASAPPSAKGTTMPAADTEVACAMRPRK